VCVCVSVCASVCACARACVQLHAWWRSSPSISTRAGVTVAKINLCFGKSVPESTSLCGPGAPMPDLRQVRLALFTLGSFDFGHRRMLGIVETCVLPYMQHERESVRKVAAVAAVQLLQRRLTFWQQHPNNIPAVRLAINPCYCVVICFRIIENSCSALQSGTH
jgi:hypothetical protein